MKKKRYDNCEGECLPYQSLVNDAVEMAKTLRDIEYACRDIIRCSEDGMVVEPICRLLMACLAPYGTKYLTIPEKRKLVADAKHVLETYGKQIEEIDAAIAERKEKKQ